MNPYPLVYRQVLVLGFATVYSDWAMLPREVVLGLSQPFIDGSSANAGVVLRGMWDVNQVGARRWCGSRMWGSQVWG